ncbi:MAG: oligosaccharide flippase family protein [Alphaproteobacteria bacterium]|nr:oligosaccharide flippase family protein [Alphaproteobacteria bacterium]
MILGHALGYLVAAVLQAVAALALVAGLTRLLSDVAFGQYGLATAALHLGQSVLYFWLKGSVSRFHATAEQEERLPSFLAGVRRWFVATSLLGAAVAVGVVLALRPSPDLRAMIWATVAAAVAQGGFTLVLETHRAGLRVWRYSLFQSLQAALSLALSLALVLAAGQAAGDTGAAWAMAGLALSYALCAAIDGRGLRFWFGGGRPPTGEMRAILLYGLPLSVAMVLDAVLATGDRFVIAQFRGEAEVGPYAAAVTLAHRSLLALCTVVGAAAAPLAFATMAQEGTDAAQRRLADACDLLLAISIPAAAGLAALAWPVSAVMVAAAMREEVAALLPWIAAGALMHGLAVHYFSQAFLLARQPVALVHCMLPVVLAYGALNLALVRPYGAAGAAYALVATQALHLVLSIVLGRRHFAVPLRWVTAAKAVVAAAIMLTALRSLGLPGGMLGLIGQIVLGAAVYGAAALVLDIARCRVRLARRLGLAP